MRSWGLICICLFSAALAGADSISGSGIVLKTDTGGGTVTVSCDAVPGVADAKVKTFRVRDRLNVASLHPGDNISFAILSSGHEALIDKIEVHPFVAVENDPSQARRMRIIAKGPKGLLQVVRAGQEFPDFTLVDQQSQRVRLQEFRGKVVAISFMYTRCALPNFCYRLSNNLGRLQNRFRQRLGRDLVLLTITFDPVHDRPEQLALYAKNWKADPKGWHFLTGTEQAIREVCDRADVDYYTDEGLLSHSLHTLVIDREGKLVTNLEGNNFSEQQLGDLVQVVLEQK